MGKCADGVNYKLVCSVVGWVVEKAVGVSWCFCDGEGDVGGCAAGADVVGKCYVLGCSVGAGDVEWYESVV